MNDSMLSDESASPTELARTIVDVVEQGGPEEVVHQLFLPIRGEGGVQAPPRLALVADGDPHLVRLVGVLGRRVRDQPLVEGPEGLRPLADDGVEREPVLLLERDRGLVDDHRAVGLGAAIRRVGPEVLALEDQPPGDVIGRLELEIDLGVAQEDVGGRPAAPVSDVAVPPPANLALEGHRDRDRRLVLLGHLGEDLVAYLTDRLVQLGLGDGLLAGRRRRGRGVAADRRRPAGPPPSARLPPRPSRA